MEGIAYFYPRYIVWAYINCVCRWPGREDILALETRALGPSRSGEAKAWGRESGPSAVGEVAPSDRWHGNYCQQECFRPGKRRKQEQRGRGRDSCNAANPKYGPSWYGHPGTESLRYRAGIRRIPPGRSDPRSIADSATSETR